MTIRTYKFNDYTFRTMTEPGEEIFGCLVDKDKWPINGTSGWWRTSDLEQAAKLAVLIHEDKMRRKALKSIEREVATQA